jgi:hypothetical protein
LPPILVTGAVSLQLITARWPRWLAASAIAASAIGLVAYQSSWNGPTFHPYRPEAYVTRTPFAEWLYTNYPSLYDPVPEVFIERAYEVDGFHLEHHPNAWAAGNYACTKLLLLRPVEDLKRLADPANPVHCIQPNDSRSVFDRIVRGEIRPSARGYVNLER